MKTEDISVCMLVIEGTWSEVETARAFNETGAKAEIVHLNQLTRKDIPREYQRDLFDYQILMFPGGFSAADCVRAGAIWAARCKKYIGEEIEEFIKNGYAVGGICNGFQVLCELGVLPGRGEIMHKIPKFALAPNVSGKFECRPSLLKNVNKGKCVFTQKYDKGQVLLIPSSHGEGRFTPPVGKEKQFVKELEDNDQIVFKFVKPDGSLANGQYPYSPNGSFEDITGICNSEGNVFGMMPHPERTARKYLHHDWTRGEDSKPKTLDSFGDGHGYFESVVEYIAKKF